MPDRAVSPQNSPFPLVSDALMDAGQCFLRLKGIGMDIVTEQCTQNLVHEKCVRCNRDTPYTFADDIASRKYYIPGYGQCCERCYEVMMQNTEHASAKHHGSGAVGAPPAVTTALALPYEYAEDEQYNVDRLGELPRKPLYAFVKRAFDIFVSLFAILLLALPMLIIAIAVKVSSPGPVLFKQERVGLNGRQFTILKFRSMCADAEKDGAKWSDGDSDTRITRVGRILRKFRLDELPQLFCILIGTMTLVGPRPELACFYRAFEKHVHGFSERLKVKPGLTGLAQVNGGYDLSPQAKVSLDIEYIRHRSVGMDLKILFKTVKVVFTHDGAK